MPDVGGIAGEHLRSFIERIERLDEEKRTLAEDIKEVYAEAKGSGFDVKIIRKIIALRRRDKDEIDEEETLLDVYKRALGMLADTPLGHAAVKEKFGAEAAEQAAQLLAQIESGDAAAMPRAIEYELGMIAGWAGRQASSDPYPVVSAAYDAWQAGWLAGGKERDGKAVKADTSRDRARTLGRENGNSLLIDNPFRSNTPEAAAWEEGWDDCEGNKMPDAQTVGASQLEQA